MSAAKHTPGPWVGEYDIVWGAGSVWAEGHGIIADVCAGEYSRGNCFVMGAASDLLEAVDHMILAHESESETHYAAAIAKLYAARAKAREVGAAR